MSSNHPVSESPNLTEESKSSKNPDSPTIIQPSSLHQQETQGEIVNSLMKQIRMFLALKYCKTDNIPSEVVPGLFIGSIGAAMSKNKLIEFGITHILCVADNINPIFPKDFTYKIVKILDSPEVKITDHLDECFDYIDSGLSNGNVLVHCFAGKSRSASVVIGYLMKVNNWTYDQAYLFLKDKRGIVEPNIGFAAQLRQIKYS